MARVILESVSKTYDSSSYAVNSLSLNVAEHSFLVLIGPSGCGKTTTLNMIAGLESISSGKIFIDEKCINDVEAKDRDIAMVFQTYALYPHLTVKDNLAFALKIRHVPKKDISAKIEKVSSLLGISQLLNRKPNQLSGGQMQRVAIGKAIMREPKVFLMDEPLSNLDASLRYKMRDELKKLHQSLNATFVYVTHDQIEAMTLGTEIAVMNEGVIQQVGSPYEVFTNPKNKFVAGFIGNPKMNFFECELKKAGDKYRFSILSIQYEFFVIDEIYENFITVGIRPEDFIITENGKELTVDYCEMIGSELIFHCFSKNHRKLEKQPVTVKTTITPDYLSIKTIRVVPCIEKIHFFDVVQGKRVSIQSIHYWEEQNERDSI